MASKVKYLKYVWPRLGYSSLTYKGLVWTSRASHSTPCGFRRSPSPFFISIQAVKILKGIGLVVKGRMHVYDLPKIDMGCIRSSPKGPVLLSACSCCTQYWNEDALLAVPSNETGVCDGLGSMRLRW